MGVLNWNEKFRELPAYHFIAGLWGRASSKFLMSGIGAEKRLRFQ
jgi:hypothetical protein